MVGWNGTGTPVSNVTISDCEVKSSPQAGVILLGVSEVDITGLHVQDTQADGLHFNACRGATVDGFTSMNTGDDALALVTYYSERMSFDQVSQAFSAPALTDGPTPTSQITNTSMTGGRANGVRLAGANRVAISAINATRIRANRLSVAIGDGIDPRANVPPCAHFDASDGFINEMDISWPQASPCWIPVRFTNGGGCGDPLAASPVAIRTLSIDPALPSRVFGC